MTMPTLDPLDILACPVCKGKLTQAVESSSLLCPTCGLTFTTRNGIPVMLTDEAQRTA